MTGLSTTVKAMRRGATKPAVRMGSARVAFLGMSSPKTMEKALTTTRAMTTAAPVAADCASQVLMSSPRSLARASCMVYPSRMVVRVMPTCAPDRSVDRRPRALRTVAARPSPSAARVSTVDGSRATRENSPETNRAVPAVSRRPSAIMSQSVTRHRPRSAMRRTGREPGPVNARGEGGQVPDGGGGRVRGPAGMPIA